MVWIVALTAVSLAASAVAVPTGNIIHEKRAIDHHFSRSRVESNAIIPLRIALKQTNLETGYDRLMEVSHPESSRYGRHLTAEEVADMFAPTDEAVNSVKSWLMDSGIPEADIMHYHNKAWLAVDLPTAKAEELLSAEYYEHELPGEGVRIGCDEYYLPVHVAPHVELIKPGVVMSARLKKRTVQHRSTSHGERSLPKLAHWSSERKRSWPSYRDLRLNHSLPEDLAHCGYNITPPCIRALYGIPKVPEHTSPENVMGLYESEDAFSQEDLDLFFAKFLPYIPQGTSPKVDSIDGGIAPVPVHSPYNTGESDIDLSLAYSLIYPQKVIVYQVDDIPNDIGETHKSGFFNDFYDAIDGSYCNYTAFGITGNSPKIDPVYPDPLKGGYKGQTMCGTYQLTRVVSASYLSAEAQFPKSYLQRQCSEIMKLGLQGHSILVAAGDTGVAVFPHFRGNPYGCLSAPGLNDQIYSPDWPAACPYITAVGATQLQPGQTVNDPESAMQLNLSAFNVATGEGPVTKPLAYFESGGGFSNFFPAPSYQKAAVEGYINSQSLPPSYLANYEATNIGANGGVWNRLGRGYPDVAANGAYLKAYVNGTLGIFFGTSLASPIFASVLTLVNEDRTAAGKGPVGFVNPVLYAHPWILNDIVNGSNPNCGSQGFHATTGWDPVTGLGTPNYPKMKELFLSLP